MECTARYEDSTAEGFPFFADAEAADHDSPEGDGVEESDEALAAEQEAEEAPLEGCDDSLKRYLNEVRKTKLLTAEEERELAVRIAAGDKAARERMIMANLRLVVSITKRYVNRGLPFSDLIEEGNIGLMKAVERFQVSKECRFSTYATWWIRQSVERALTNQARTIRLPVHIADDVSRMQRMTHALRRKLNREPALSEVADGLGVDEKHLRKLMTYMKPTHSLHHACGEDKDHLLIDTIEDGTVVSPSTLWEGINSYQKISELIETLTDSEKKILTLRFGLDDHEPETLEEIGARFGVTRERIRQIESKSLVKLRALLKAQEQAVAYC